MVRRGLLEVGFEQLDRLVGTGYPLEDASERELGLPMVRGSLQDRLQEVPGSLGFLNVAQAVGLQVEQVCVARAGCQGGLGGFDGEGPPSGLVVGPGQDRMGLGAGLVADLLKDRDTFPGPA